jgi:hypothetical protein
MGLGEAPVAHLITGYALDVDEDADGVIRPLVHVETPEPGNRVLGPCLAEAVRARLLANSADSARRSPSRATPAKRRYILNGAAG